MKHQVNPPGLYVVGTPIGNLEDLSARAKHILAEVDWIAAEDTRETGKLLQAFGLQKSLFSLHEHSSEKKIEDLLVRLRAGDRGAYVSDAGTPGVSDPGADLVLACHKEGIRVLPIPGASAVTTLLSASGFSGTGFSFHGFFPRESSARKKICTHFIQQGGVHIFFESPYRVQEMLSTFCEFFPDASLVMGRELTKIYETITFTTPRNLAEFFTKEMPRGEFVFALELPKSELKDLQGPKDMAAFLESLVQLGANQKLLVAVVREFGYRKNEAYELALKALGK